MLMKMERGRVHLLCWAGDELRLRQAYLSAGVAESSIFEAMEDDLSLGHWGKERMESKSRCDA